MEPCVCLARPACVDSRGDKSSRRRRYRCPSCGAKWTTCEVPVIITDRNAGTRAAMTEEQRRFNSMYASIET